MSLLLQLIYVALVFIPATSSAARAAVSKVPLHHLLKRRFRGCFLRQLHTICTPKIWNGDNADGLGGCTRHQWGVLTCFTQVKASKLLRALGGFFRLVSTIYVVFAVLRFSAKCFQTLPSALSLHTICTPDTPKCTPNSTARGNRIRRGCPCPSCIVHKGTANSQSRCYHPWIVE